MTTRPTIITLTPLPTPEFDRELLVLVDMAMDQVDQALDKALTVHMHRPRLVGALAAASRAMSLAMYGPSETAGLFAETLAVANIDVDTMASYVARSETEEPDHELPPYLLWSDPRSGEA